MILFYVGQPPSGVRLREARQQSFSRNEEAFRD